MYSDTESYLEYTGNIICWLIICIFVGYLSAQILAWVGRGPQLALGNAVLQDMQCGGREALVADNDSADSDEPVEFGVFRDMRWQVVRI